MESAENNYIENIVKLHYHLAHVFSTGTTSPLHVFITFSRTTIDQLPQAAYNNDRRITLMERSPNFYSIKIRIRKRGATGWLVTQNNLWLFYIKSDESSIVGTIADDWISGMSPYISKARIPHPELYALLDSLNGITKSGIIIQDYLAHSFKQGRSRSSFGRDWASQKGWEGRPYDDSELQSNVAKSNKILQAVRIAFPDEKTSFEARISRVGHMTFYRGQEHGFSNFYDRVIDTYIQKAIDYKNTLENREAKQTQQKDVVNPIKFTPKKNLRLPDLERMVDAVVDQPELMVSIIHKGNPWLYLSIIDRTDGNACELLGFEDEIQIVPQFRSTPMGLAKVEDLVYEVFPSVTKVNGNSGD